MVIRIVFLTLILTTISITPCKTVFAESLMGQVQDRGGRPIPGVEVILYNPAVGPSSPRFTDYNGIFYFPYVPFQSSGYDLEFYWRRRLIFRRRISIQGHIRLPPIRLE